MQISDLFLDETCPSRHFQLSHAEAGTVRAVIWVFSSFICSCLSKYVTKKQTNKVTNLLVKGPLFFKTFLNQLNPSHSFTQYKVPFNFFCHLPVLLDFRQGPVICFPTKIMCAFVFKSCDLHDLVLLSNFLHVLTTTDHLRPLNWESGIYSCRLHYSPSSYLSFLI